MDRVLSRRRRLLSWVPSVVLVLLIAGAGMAAIAVNNSWWVQPSPTAAPDQTAPNGASVFTAAGVDYLMRIGEVRIRMDEKALPAEALGLETDGTRTISSEDRPLVVQVAGTDGALAVDRVSQVVLATEDGELVSVDVRREVPGGFLEAHAMLADVANLYGWSADEVAAVPERVGDARRDNPEEPVSVSVGPGDAVGLDVSATLIVDGGSAVVFTARPVR